MSERYLWDKSGPIDPEIQGLESLLGEFRQRESARPAGWSRRRWVSGAIAASVSVAAGLWWRGRETQASGWVVSALEGAPWVDRQALSGTAALSVGGRLVTGAQTRAVLTKDAVGRLEVEPGSHLRIVSVQQQNEEFALQQGTIHAVIWAPPGEFSVQTPAAIAVDLGCAYTLSVDRKGVGTVEVTTGWVAFARGEQESFIPAGARCRTFPKQGPGIPVYADTPAALQQWSSRWETTGSIDGLGPALSTARERDALVLWHILRRVAAAERGQVFDRLASLLTLPATIQREAMLRGDVEQIDALWNSLGLGEAAWWRTWRQKLR